MHVCAGIYICNMLVSSVMLAYKLVRAMHDGSLAPLFINMRMRLPFGVWLKAECHPTKGFAVRPRWHCLAQPVAPHLSPKGRVWLLVDIDDYEEYVRPKAQGWLWYLAQRMKVIRKV